jgi:NDP-sugar pyrophosphorylase family protein
MVAKNYQKGLMKNFNGKTLIRKQVDFFEKNGIKDIIILTQHSNIINTIIDEIQGTAARIVEIKASTNGEALGKLSKKIDDDNMIVMNGNIFLEFDLKNMIKQHLKEQKLASIGLMSSKEVSKFGNIVMDGDLVVEFKEKPTTSESFIVNGGIYIFKKESMELIDDKPIEQSFLPRLAKIKQAYGYFINARYKKL